MLLGLLAMFACGGGEPAPAAVGSGVPTLLVDVVARVGEPGAPAAWAARAAPTASAAGTVLAPGECRRTAPANDTAGVSELEALAIGGSTPAVLAWDRASGAWSAPGPRQSPDPAWSVSTLTWTDGAGEHKAPDIVRFGGVPAVTRVTREREGAVTLAWDPGTVESPSVIVAGPAGLLECGVGAEEVVLPWWAVPANGGAVVLRSTRSESQLVDGVLLQVRTTIERVVPLDRPAGTTAGEETPDFEPYSPNGPRRVVRRTRTPIG